MSKVEIVAAATIHAYTLFYFTLLFPNQNNKKDLEACKRWCSDVHEYKYLKLFFNL